MLEPRKQVYICKPHKALSIASITQITPIPLTPDFEMPANIFGINKAIVTITQGWQPGDTLELDSNYTVVKIANEVKLENTNIVLPEGGFNPQTKRLVLVGADSISTYEDILSSILLDSTQPLAGSYHEINFTIVDDEGVRHLLGKLAMHVPPTLLI